VLKKIIVGISVLVLILFAMAALQSGTYTVQRSVSIKAPPGKIIPLISDFHQWPQWSPWENTDPSMKRSFSGAPRDVGAVYIWDGNNKAGSGRMEVISVTPAKVGIKLDFGGPNASTALMDFVLAPQGDSTTVSWTLTGNSDFMGKMMNIFISMDSVIGPAFDSGLAKMKAAAEK
jgi:hypothetical protein